jgi:hypothetical protein
VAGWGRGEGVDGGHNGAQQAQHTRLSQHCPCPSPLPLPPGVQQAVATTSFSAPPAPTHQQPCGLTHLSCALLGDLVLQAPHVVGQPLLSHAHLGQDAHLHGVGWG